MRLNFQKVQNIFSFKGLKNENATSLIETLVAVSLSLVIALIAYQILRHSIFTNKIISNDYNKGFQALRIRSLTEDIIGDLNAHPLPIEPKIFKDGQLVINGQSIIISEDLLKQPSRKSDAISFLELDFINRIPVKLNEEQILEGCSEKINPNLEQRYLGIDLKGANYLQGEVVAISKGCYQFYITQKPNLIISKRSEDFPIFSTLLIPIINEYLVYKDQSQRLRYVTLQGLLTKENQPLFEKAPDLTIELLKYEQIWQLAFNWKYPEDAIQKSFKIVQTSEIARQAFQNLVINS